MPIVRRKIVKMPSGGGGGSSSRPRRICTSCALFVTLVLLVCRQMLLIESSIDEERPASVAAPLKRELATKGAGLKVSCDYDKGQWLECDSDGLQRKILQLKAGGSSECKTNKTIRRECETTVGCKYARGQWSSGCVNGQRHRVDTLVARVGGAKSGSGPNIECKPQRRVTKDCRRTCHYLKSVWSECTNGFRTRTLTLDVADGSNVTSNVVDVPTAPQATEANQNNNSTCARHKLIKRKCRPISVNAVSNTTSNSTTPNGANTTPRPGQRRRLKQFQQMNKRQQQQQQSGPISLTSSPGPIAPPGEKGAKVNISSAITTATTTTTTTGRRRRRRR